MKIYIEEIEDEKVKTLVDGYLLNEELSFELANSYTQPFLAGNNSIINTIANITTGASAKFSYMYYQIWEGSTTPEINISVLFVAYKNAKTEVMDKVNALFDMFAPEIKNGRLVVSGLPIVMQDNVVNSIMHGNLTGIKQSIKYNRLISIKIGEKIFITDLLPAKINFKGFLPLMRDGYIGYGIVEMSFIRKNLLFKGEKFLGV